MLSGGTHLSCCRSQSHAPPPPHLFLFSLPMWTLSLRGAAFCTFKATYIREKKILKKLLWIQLKSHMNGTSELSPFNPQRVRGKKRCFSLNVQIFQILKTHLVLFRKKGGKKEKEIAICSEADIKARSLCEALWMGCSDWLHIHF